MLKLCIGDTLRIARSSTEFAWSWGYRLIDFSTGSPIVVKTAEGYSTSQGVTFQLTSAVFGDYIGKELLLEIYNVTNNIVTERDYLIISGVYNKFEQAKKLLRLLGHNIKKLAENSTDWQDGHMVSQVVTTYSEAALTTELEEYEWTQSFVQDFTPDYRYFSQGVTQKESAT